MPNVSTAKKPPPAKLQGKRQKRVWDICGGPRADTLGTCQPPARGQEHWVCAEQGTGLGGDAWAELVRAGPHLQGCLSCPSDCWGLNTRIPVLALGGQWVSVYRRPHRQQEQHMPRMSSEG